MTDAFSTWMPDAVDAKLRNDYCANQIEHSHILTITEQRRLGVHMGANQLLTRGFWLNADEAQVRDALERGVVIGAIDQFGRNPLHLAAAFSGNATGIDALLEAGVDIQTVTGYGATPLHLAAAYNLNHEIVRRLLAHGADINAKIDLPDAPIFWVDVADIEPMLASIWLDFQDDMREMVSGSTPLHWMIMWGAGVEIIQHLLESGAQVNAVNDAGWTPLHWAAMTSLYAEEKIALLVEWGADRDALTRAGETVHQVGERFA